MTIPVSRAHPNTGSASHGEWLSKAALAADAELRVQLRSLADHRALELALAKVRRKSSSALPSTDLANSAALNSMSSPAAEFHAAPRSAGSTKVCPSAAAITNRAAQPATAERE
jgi:hypothetical protein